MGGFAVLMGSEGATEVSSTPRSFELEPTLPASQTHHPLWSPTTSAHIHLVEARCPILSKLSNLEDRHPARDEEADDGDERSDRGEREHRRRPSGLGSRARRRRQRVSQVEDVRLSFL